MDFNFDTSTISNILILDPAGSTLQVAGTTAFIVPVGTNAQRPSTTAGALRFDSTSGQLEYFDGSFWQTGLSANSSLSWSNVTGTPTTLAGYGITNAMQNFGSATGMSAGLFSAMPAASGGNAGQFYYATDTNATYYSNGVSWSLNEAAISGDVSIPAGSQTATLATVNSNVGTFAVQTVNAKGLVTAASALSATGDATGTSVGANLALTLATVNTNVGTFGSTTAIPVVTVNAKGLVTAVTTATISGAITLAGDVSGTGSTGGTVTTTLANVNVNVGSFGSATTTPTFTVNAKGLVTAASNVTIAAPVTLTGDVTGAGVTGTSFATTLANVTTGGTTGDSTHVTQLTFNAKGLVISASNVAIASSTATGDVTGTLTPGGSSALTLATVNSNVGTFTAVTVNGKGLVTSATNQTFTGDATGTASGSSTALTLATVNGSPVTAAFSKVTVNGKGLTTATTPVVQSDIISTLGYTPVSATGNVAMTGNLNLAGFNINNVATPAAATDAVNKQYVDSVAQGLSFKQTVAVGTTTNLSATYNNGTAGVGATLTATANGVLTLDGYTPVLGDRILVKNQTDQTQDGIYVVSTLGTVSVPYVLTRSTDTNTSAELTGAYVFINSGTGQADTSWAQVTVNPTIGTSNIVWTQFGGAGSYSAGTGLTLSGTVFSITPVGTAGTYTAVTTNAQGQVTSGANMTITGDATGTASGTSLALTLANVAVAGTTGDSTHTTQITFNSKGLVTSATNVAIASSTVTGDVTGTLTPGASAALTLATVNTNTGTWGSATSVPQFTVNGKGLVTAVSNVAIAAPVTIAGDASGSGVTGGTTTVTLATVNSNVGTFGSTTSIPVVTVNAKGLVTAVSTAAISGAITLVGDATGSGTTGGNTTVTLNTVNANVGTFAVQTVNGKGLVTSAANLVVSGDVSGTSSGATLGLTLATVNANVGTFTATTINGKGLVTSATNLTATGDATGTASGSSIALTLANSGVVAGTYPNVTVNSKGIVTSANAFMNWSAIQGTPTTLAGYGITNGVVNAGTSPSLQSGTLASRPAAGTAGALYVATDTNTLYRDNGTSWTIIGDSPLYLYNENPVSPASNTTTGNNAISLGAGLSSTQNFGLAIGNQAAVRNYGGVAKASGDFATVGDAQTETYVLRGITTNNTQTQIYLDGSGSQMVLTNNSTWTFRILITAHRTDAIDRAGWIVEGVIGRDAGAATTALSGTPSTTTLRRTDTNFAVAVSADTTNGALSIKVTGNTGKTVRWVATVWTTEVTS